PRPSTLLRPTRFPYTTLFRSRLHYDAHRRLQSVEEDGRPLARYTHNAFGQTIRRETKQQTQEYDYINNQLSAERDRHGVRRRFIDRKSTRLNSSHVSISYAVA